MNIAAVVLNDTANAPGICTSVYFAGCDRHCYGCHNEAAWDFNCGHPMTIQDVASIGASLVENGVHRDLCILGGEPLHTKNVYGTYALAKYVKENYPETKIYVWTGYELEELLQRAIDDRILQFALDYTDVLIDGPYIDSQRDVTLPMRGSRNQRIHYLKENAADE